MLCGSGMAFDKTSMQNNINQLRFEVVSAASLNIDSVIFINFHHKFLLLWKQNVAGRSGSDFTARSTAKIL